MARFDLSLIQPATLIASVKTLPPPPNSDAHAHERRVSHAAAVGLGPANYSVPRGIRGDT